MQRRRKGDSRSRRLTRHLFRSEVKPSTPRTTTAQQIKGPLLRIAINRGHQGSFATTVETRRSGRLAVVGTQSRNRAKHLEIVNQIGTTGLSGPQERWRKEVPLSRFRTDSINPLTTAMNKIGNLSQSRNSIEDAGQLVCRGQRTNI